ncbi:MAG: D-alanine--D-alanine ligase [Gammaproteobacteria bacterium]
MTGRYPRISRAADFGRVAVLMGGLSSEREVSLKSGAQVLAGLTAEGVDAHPVDAGDEVLRQLQGQGFDRVFNILHGTGGEDGVIQGALDVLGLPYTGSGVMASALAMDKWRSKLIWQGAGLPVPAYRVVDQQSDFDSVVAELGLPLFVKPANEGSSVGVTRVERVEDLRPAVEAALRFDPLVLVERCLDGGEYTVSLLQGEALPAIRIEAAGAFYDYEAKYLRDDTRYHCPCGLSAEREQQMQSLAREGFRLLGCEGWGRVDFLLDREGNPHLLEVNTVPGMTDHSLVPMAARAAGVAFGDLVWRILETSFVERKGWRGRAEAGQ